MKKGTVLLLIAASCVVVVIVIWAPLFTQWFGYSRPKTGADLGQLYGWVAALFSGLAFVGVIEAIILQQQEL
jgi:uncharacterized membrane protein